MKQRDSKAAATLVGAAALVVLASGTAQAYWVTVGNGAASASTGTSAAVTAPPAATVDPLFPGTTAGGSVRVSNPNAFEVVVTGITFARVTATGGRGECVDTGVTFHVPPVLPVPVAPGATAAVPFTAAMATSSPSGCQGATFTTTFDLEAVYR